MRAQGGLRGGADLDARVRQGVLKLPNDAPPRRKSEKLRGLDRQLELGRGILKRKLREQQDVVWTLAKRRDFYGDTGETVEEIGAKTAAVAGRAHVA